MTPGQYGKKKRRKAKDHITTRTNYRSNNSIIGFCIAKTWLFVTRELVELRNHQQIKSTKEKTNKKAALHFFDRHNKTKSRHAHPIRCFFFFFSNTTLRVLYRCGCGNKSRTQDPLFFTSPTPLYICTQNKESRVRVKKKLSISLLSPKSIENNSPPPYFSRYEKRVTYVVHAD